ncbi:nickel-binding protein [Mycobacterium colombiense]
MPTYLTTHQSPGLSADEIANNAPDVAESKYAAFQHLYVDMYNGFLVTVYLAASREELEREFERVGFPFDEIHEIQFALDAPGLQAMIEGAPTS